jgi:hypothetical protein
MSIPRSHLDSLAELAREIGHVSPEATAT